VVRSRGENAGGRDRRDITGRDQVRVRIALCRHGVARDQKLCLALLHWRTAGTWCGDALKPIRTVRHALLVAGIPLCYEDDIEGIVQCYRDTQEALRQRRLPVSDVATRMRLSKDSKTYLAKRAKHAEAQYEALLAAGRKQWRAGERVRFYRSMQGVPVWLPDEADDASPISDEEHEDETEESEESLFATASTAPSLPDRRDYDIEHYLRILRDSYAERLRVVFEAEDFSQLFRLDGQQGLFDRPIEHMHLRWIRCQAPRAKE
jgi:hypothetical protein